MNFAEKLKTIRKQFSMSQEQFAEKLKVSRQAVTKWETGNGMPDIDNILTIASLFNITVDELLSDKKSMASISEFQYKSTTEYDIDNEKHYDINIGCAYKVNVTSTKGEKILVRLASNTIETLEQDCKVKIDDIKKRIDIEVNRSKNLNDAQAKQALYVFLEIPDKFLLGIEVKAYANTLNLSALDIENFEFDGKVNDVFLSEVKGHVHINSSQDMNIACDSLNGSLDINQLLATTILNIPKGTSYYASKKGLSNTILYCVDNKPIESLSDKASENTIELNGMNSELTINEFSDKGAESE